MYSMPPNNVSLYVIYVYLPDFYCKMQVEYICLYLDDPGLK